MAKSRSKDGKTATEGRPRPDKAVQAEARLRAYHALGQKVLERIAPTGQLDRDTLDQLIAETGHGFSTLDMARIFARAYTPMQLDTLCALRTPRGLPLAWRLVRQLVMIPAGPDRDRLQGMAARHGWTL